MATVSPGRVSMRRAMAVLLLALLYPVFFSADAPPLPAPAATAPQWWLSVM
tara:strand:- start:508 stop:660 length:153 start_codon:yes stop_codon:yes gene_type:complete